MQKIQKTFICLVLIIGLSSCFSSNVDDEVTQAKKDLGIIETNNNDLDSNPIDEIDNNAIDKNSKNKKEVAKKTELIKLTPEQFLEFDSLEGLNLLGGEIEITGKTLTGVDEISVEFNNETSNYPKDNYVLKTFSSGDKIFKYRAFSNYETLDFGKNEYIFTAKSKDNISKTKIILNVIKNSQEEEKNNSSTNLTGDINLELMPIGEKFGTPKKIGNGKITYSDIKGLEIEKKESNIINCDINTETNNYYLNEFLDKELGGYYWWNTCRPFGNKEGISYYVIRLDGNSYVYEKHIYLNNGIYGIYELDKADDFISKDDKAETINNKLKEKNDELKIKNSTFEVTEIVNDLFTKILNNLK